MKKCFTFLFYFLSSVSLFAQGAIYTQGPLLNYARVGSNGFRLDDGKMVILGGHGTNFINLSNAEIWNPVNNTFTEKPLNGFRDGACIIKLSNGKFMIIGGYSSDLGVGHLSSMELYDPDNNTFTILPQMTNVRAQARGVQLSSGKVIIIGSWWNDVSAIATEIYDPSTNTVTAGSDFPFQICNAFWLPMFDGSALGFGGYNPFGSSTYEMVYKYDQNANAYSIVRNKLFEADSGWMPLYNVGDMPQYSQMMDHRYIMLATKNSGNSVLYKLFTVDPATNVIDTFYTNPPLLKYDLTTGDSLSYLTPLLDKPNNRLILIAVRGVIGGSEFVVTTVNLNNHQYNIPSGPRNQLTYYIHDIPKFLLNDGRVLMPGGNISNNFDPVDKTFFLTVPATAVGEENQMPSQFVLSQNYPNPFNPSTAINYSLPASGNVSLIVYDMLGREVAVLFNGFKPAGKYQSEVNLTGTASGIYFYKLTSGSYSKTMKMVLMR